MGKSQPKLILEAEFPLMISPGESRAEVRDARGVADRNSRLL